jgi:hypothetical protein
MADKLCEKPYPWNPREGGAVVAMDAGYICAARQIIKAHGEGNGLDLGGEAASS